MKKFLKIASIIDYSGELLIEDSNQKIPKFSPGVKISDSNREIRFFYIQRCWITEDRQKLIL